MRNENQRNNFSFAEPNGKRKSRWLFSNQRDNIID